MRDSKNILPTRQARPADDVLEPAGERLDGGADDLHLARHARRVARARTSRQRLAAGRARAKQPERGEAEEEGLHRPRRGGGVKSRAPCDRPRVERLAQVNRVRDDEHDGEEALGKHGGHVLREPRVGAVVEAEETRQREAAEDRDPPAEGGPLDGVPAAHGFGAAGGAITASQSYMRRRRSARKFVTSRRTPSSSAKKVA